MFISFSSNLHLGGPGDRVAQLYPQAPGSLFVAFYDSQGYGGGILIRLHTGPTHAWMNLGNEEEKTD
jgi:hypothetical protein